MNHMKLTRRKMLAASLGCSGAFATGGLAALARFGFGIRNQTDDTVTRTSRALGAAVSITVLGVPEPRANRAIDAALAEIETVETVMSLYRPDSQLCRLNRNGVLDRPHPYLVEVLVAARETSRLSDGAFDVTVQPLWQLFSTCRKDGRLPSESEIAAARRSVVWRGIECSADRVRLLDPVTAVTLNGIAQGFAADRAVAALRSHGVEHALVNTGEIGSVGAKPDGRDWTAGIQHPRVPDAYVSLAALRGRSLATSGDYATKFAADFSKNHIFDPRTGESPGETASASIAAPTAMQADALSTAAMVLGVDQTLALIAQLPDVDALLVRKDGRVQRTIGFEEAPDV
jgi:thiamine biosynthesis lipoprotein